MTDVTDAFEAPATAEPTRQTRKSHAPRPHSQASRLAFALALLGIVAFWGATFPIVKQATEDFSVLGFLALRFAVATLALAPFAIPRLSRSAVRIGVMIGVVFGASYLLQTYGLQFTTSSNAGIITGMFIVFVPLTGWLLFRMRTGWWLWLGIAVSVAGLIMLTDAGQQGFQHGDILTLLCAAGFGLHITLLGRYAREFSAVALSFVQLSFCAMITALMWPAFEPVRMPDGAEWTAIIATALLGSALALLVQTKAQQRLSAVSAALIIMTEPIFAAAFSQWMLGERLNLGQWGGAALMVLAMVMVVVLPSRAR